MDIQRRVITINLATRGQLVDGVIEGVDTVPDNPEVPFWQPDSADELDKLIAAIAAQQQDHEAAAKYHAAQAKGYKSRILKMLNVYAPLIAGEVPVDIGKSHRFWKGEHSEHIGQYTHNPNREPALKLGADATAAVKENVAMTSTVASLDTPRARDYMARKGRPALEALGVTVTDQPTVTFKLKDKQPAGES